MICFYVQRTHSRQHKNFHKPLNQPRDQKGIIGV